MDQEVLNQLYRRYSRELYLYLYTLCRSRTEAEDLLQETFLKALLSLPEHHPNLRAWLYLVARNLYFNQLKKSGRLVFQEVPERLPAPDTDPLERLIAEEKYRTLYRSLSQLELRQREVLQLQYFSGLSQREIAAVLHLTPEHVRVLAHRGRKELKRRMEENGYDLP